jgi:hypothetical protein
LKRGRNKKVYFNRKISGPDNAESGRIIPERFKKDDPPFHWVLPFMVKQKIGWIFLSLAYF